MEQITTEPRALIFSIRLYKALLLVYPSEFRLAYGGPMLQVFRDCSLRALRENGHAGLLSLWSRTMLDTVNTAIEEHTQRGVEMSIQKFIRLSGWALMLGSLTFGLAFLAGTRPEYNRYDVRSLAIDQYANALEGPLSIVAMILLSVGFIGLFLRYGQAASSFGRISLGLGAFSGVISAIGATGLAIYDSDHWWNIFFFGMILQFLSLVLFGVTSLRQHTLPRWNGLPVLAGVWVPLYVLASLLIEQGSGSWIEWPLAVDLLIWLFTLSGLVGLGYLLQSNAQQTDMAVAGV